MLQENCVPVQVALSLLDSSSLGLANRAQEFQDAKSRLQNALRAVVNEHHQGFNSSIGTFHQIQASITASHDRIRGLRDSLNEAKANLGTAKPEFKSLALSSHSYANMLDILEMIEELQSVPGKLEASISEKRFLAAVDMLQDALKLAKRSELEDIGALADLKVYLSNQEISLADILTEELHNHLYLKSPYCEDRWKEYAKSNEQKDGPLALPGVSRRELFAFLESLDTSEPLDEDASKNPEADSFHYIYVIAESLYKLGRLDEAVDAIEQRLPVELYKVVERSNSEVQQKHPSALQAEWKYRKGPVDIPSVHDAHNIVLSDLIQTLYARFEAIAEAHRVFHEVIGGITKREDGVFDTRLTRSFKELWKLYQSEMRSLLHDYLSTRGTAERLGQSENESNIFRYQREKGKKCTFKMELIDGGSASIREEREEVVQTWQKFVPGLTSLAKDAASTNTTSTNMQLDSSAAGHKLLVEPSVFNIGSLLPPSVSFLNRLKEIVPGSADIVVGTLSFFLNDFLINVFQPQLEETLTEFCSQTFLQLDAFQQDEQWPQYSRKPIFRGTIRFYKIISAFCRMLDDLTHDQAFTHLVITQMNDYYEKCNSWYRALASRAEATADGRQLKAAAFFSESTKVKEVAMALREADMMDSPKLVNEECALLIANTKDHPLEQADLMLDRKSHAYLCLLHNSMNWLGAKLSKLRRISDRATDSSYQRRDSVPQPLKRSLTSTLSRGVNFEDEAAYLPLNSETVELFDGVIKGVNELSSLALRTLHLELRCHMLHTLGPHFRQSSYLLTDPIEAADENVVGLVTEMLSFDQEVRTYLSSRSYAYVTTGYAQLADTIVMGNVQRHIRSINLRGREYLQINADVLYHNLLNIAADADLPRTFEFLHLFHEGPNVLVALAWKGGLKLGYEELRTLIELCYSDSKESADEERAARAEKDMQENLAQLSEAMGKTA